VSDTRDVLKNEVRKGKRDHRLHLSELRETRGAREKELKGEGK